MIPISSSLQTKVALAPLCLLLCLVSVCHAQEVNFTPGELTWKNGDKVPGHIVASDAKRLQWQSQNLFRDPLNVDLSYLRQVDFAPKKKSIKTSEDFSIQTIDGFSLYGKITKLDDRFLYVSSARFGELVLERSQIATIFNLKTSGSLINGEFDLSKWNASRGEKKYWTVNEEGELQSHRNDVHLFLKSELPQSALIEVELKWEKKLDFVFGFGVPRSSRNIETLPRLESWDDSIVMSFNDDFEIVMESVNADAKRLKFLIHWNRDTHVVVIHDEKGVPLATANLGKPGKRIESGIYIENKSGDLRVAALTIRRSAAGFDATQPSIQTLDEAALNGQIESFDGSLWTITTTDDSGQPDTRSTIQADKFCGAFLINPAVERAKGQTRLRFQDGMYVGGKFVSVANNKIEIETTFSQKPILFKLDNVVELGFAAVAGPSNENEFSHRLFNKAGQIQGRLESGSGDTDDILRWRVAGAEQAVPFSQADARIILRKKQSIVAVPQQWADTLFLANRDTIPCRIVSIDEESVTFESFTENGVIDHEDVKAIDFRNSSISEKIDPQDESWMVLKGGKRRFKTTETKMIVSEGSEFGHPWLLSSGGFEFDLAWRTGQYGVLECRLLVGDLKSGAGGKKVNIMLYGDNLFVSDTTVPNQVDGTISVVKNKARVAVQLRRGQLVLLINGKKAYSGRVATGTNRGRGVLFKLNDMYGQNIKCSLSNFELNFSDSGNGSLVDPKRKELLLTIPRFQKKRPPKHVLCASNTDMLRGELVSLDKDFVFFRANGEVKRFPRNIVISVVWLHADDLKEKVTDEQAPATEKKEVKSVQTTEKVSASTTETVSLNRDEQKVKDENKAEIAGASQTVQVLMQGGRRMTSTLSVWTDNNLVGQSAVLGECRIPFDQIYELRFGSYATKATDVPYADWVASLAPAPKMESGGSGDSDSDETFGSSSPLIGTIPKSFTVSMLDGSKISLSKQRGKVVVLDFWATWCGPCVKALPGMADTLAGYSPDDVVFVAINQEEGKEQIKTFLESRQLNIPVGLDSGKIGRQFEVEALPQTVIIDREGKIAFVKVGSSNDLETKLKAAIDQLLAAPQQ